MDVIMDVLFFAFMILTLIGVILFAYFGIKETLNN